MALKSIAMALLAVAIASWTVSASADIEGEQVGAVVESRAASRHMLQTCGINAGPVNGVCKCLVNNQPVGGGNCCRPNAVVSNGVCICKSTYQYDPNTGNCVPKACLGSSTIVACLLDPSNCVSGIYCSCADASAAGARNCVRPLTFVDGNFCCKF